MKLDKGRKGIGLLKEATTNVTISLFDVTIRKISSDCLQAADDVAIVVLASEWWTNLR